MEDWITPHLAQLLAWLAFPEHGLSTVFLISFISATLLPLGSEPAVFGLIKINPDLFWPAIGVATAGNTLGGIVSWWMGYGAHQAVDLVKKSNTPQTLSARAGEIIFTVKPWHGLKKWARRLVCCLGCLGLVIRFALWRVGSKCPCYLAPSTWPLASFCAMW